MPAVTAPPKYQRRPDRPRPPRASPGPSLARSRSRSATPGGPARCKHCNAATLVPEEGGLVCQSCGIINEEDSNFRAEIEFDESSSGAVKTRGTHIGAHQSHSRTYTSRVASAAHVGQEATKASERARTDALHKVQHFATFLHIRDPEVDRAMYLFEQAYNRQFYRGRTLEAVAIVCLYLAIRQCTSRDRYAVMLIDFAELSQGGYNVFELGKMAKLLQQMLYLDASRERWWSLEKQKAGATDAQRAIWSAEQDNLYKGKDMLSLQDPEDLIERFCDRLDFGDQTNAVKRDSAKVAQSMNRNWMTTGRRPAGIAGAAVIIAARMNNYRRTLREVVLVAKVTEITLSKRIEEFKETATSGMSIQDFRLADPNAVQAGEPQNPPAYYRAQPEWQAKHKKRKRRKKGAPLPESAGALENDEDEQSVTETEGEDDGDQENQEASSEPVTKRPRLDADGFAVPDIPVRPSQASTDQPSRFRAGRPKGTKNWAPRPLTAEEESEEAELEGEIREQLNINASLDPTGTIADSTENEEEIITQIEGVPDPKDYLPRVTRYILGPDASSTIGNTGEGISMGENLANDEFEDDPDVSNCLLNDAERAFKETVWVEENKDWLRLEHAKKIKRELKDRELREKGIDPDKERLKKSRRKDGMQRAGRVGDISYLNDVRNKTRAGEESTNDANAAIDDAKRRSVSIEARGSVQVMLQQRGTFSRRVDYNKLSQAYVLPGFEDSSESRSESPAVSDSFYRPQLSRGMPAADRRRAKQRAGQIASAYETDYDTDADNGIRNGEDEDAEHDPDTGTSEARQQLPTPAATQSQSKPIIIREGSADSGSPLSSTHTPVGFGSNAPNTPQPPQLRQQITPANDEDDDDDDSEDDDDDEDDEDDPGNDLEKIFAAGSEMLNDEDEELVEDE